MRSDSFKDIVKQLNKSKIPYSLTNESLIGFSEGNIHKFSPNIHFFVFDFKLAKKIYFALRCLLYGIIVKPKKIDGVIRFKIRKRSSIFSKEGAYVWLHILNKMDKGWEIMIGKRRIEYSDLEFSPKNQVIKKINNVNVNLPNNWKTLVIKARNKLLTEFYPIQPISLNTKHEYDAIELLRSTTQILDKLKIKYWLEGGTLLGAVRNQKLIPWDHDLDIGINFSTNEDIKKLIRTLKQRFYVRPLTFPSDPNIWDLGDYRVIKVYTKKSFFKRSNLCLDIFLYYKGTVEGKGEMYRYVVWGNNACHPKKYFDNLEEILFYDSIYKIPSNPEKFLQNKYGSDWKTPKKKWNVAIDDGSIIR